MAPRLKVVLEKPCSLEENVEFLFNNSGAILGWTQQISAREQELCSEIQKMSDVLKNAEAAFRWLYAKVGQLNAKTAAKARAQEAATRATCAADFDRLWQVNLSKTGVEQQNFADLEARISQQAAESAALKKKMHALQQIAAENRILTKSVQAMELKAAETEKAKGQVQALQ